MLSLLRENLFPRTLRDLSSIVLRLAFLFCFINAHSPYRDSPFVLKGNQNKLLHDTTHKFPVGELIVNSKNRQKL